MSEVSRGEGSCKVEFNPGRRGVVSLRTVQTSGQQVDITIDLTTEQAQNLAAVLVAVAEIVGEGAASIDAHANASIGAQRR